MYVVETHFLSGKGRVSTGHTYTCPTMTEALKFAREEEKRISTPLGAWISEFSTETDCEIECGRGPITMVIASITIREQP